jgi:hypothetical protein
MLSEYLNSPIPFDGRGTIEEFTFSDLNPDFCQGIPGFLDGWRYGIGIESAQMGEADVVIL